MATTQSVNFPLNADDKLKKRMSAPVVRKPVPTVDVKDQTILIDRATLTAYSSEDQKTKEGVVSIYEVPTSPLLSSTLSSIPTPPRLDKPVVIPSVCIADSTYHPIGLPIVRAYAACLDAYDFSDKSFVAFIDELNLMNRGHVQTFKNISRAGKVVKIAGHFDPTGITKVVGAGIEASAHLGGWASIEGPLSRKKSYLDTANETLFAPRGLTAEIIGTDELRKRLNISKDRYITAPLNVNWVVPTKEQLNLGQRCTPRAPHRIILALLDHVQNIRLFREGNPLASGHMNSDTAFDEATRKQQTSRNAREVRNLQVGTELVMSNARREAIGLLMAANAIMGTSAKEQKEKHKLLKKANEKDLEVHATKKMKWLIITNL